MDGLYEYTGGVSYFFVRSKERTSCDKGNLEHWYLRPTLYSYPFLETEDRYLAPQVMFEWQD